MNTAGAPKSPDFNGRLFVENRNRVPLETLLPYRGRYVAWNLEGTQIVASGNDEGELLDELRRKGFDLTAVVQSFVDEPDEASLIGGWFGDESAE